jgi:hypothetical protein
VTPRQSLFVDWPTAALAALSLARPRLEATMQVHMGIELPLLFLLGWASSMQSRRRAHSPVAGANFGGIPGLFFALCATSIWMLPVALDLAVLNPYVGTAKVACFVLSGFVFHRSWQLAPAGIRAFFAMNWVWMAATAGLLYQTTVVQLCSVYLADQQQKAGAAAIMWACAGCAVWLASIARDSLGKQPDGPLHP